MTCPSCGKELPGDFPFCPFCGAALDAVPSVGREERKVVTVVFVDLVGFTARAERLDPEDVRAVLAPYHARLRADLERHGGTVEKFNGDAVMALFGAPIAREDDPERAVRASHVLALAVGPDGALPVARELLDSLRAGVDMQFAVVNLPMFAAAADRLGLLDELAAALEGRPATPWTKAVQAHAAGDFAGAADIMRRVGSKPDEAEARLQAARGGDAEDQLEQALAFYRSVDAQYYVRECEAVRAAY